MDGCCLSVGVRPHFKDAHTHLCKRVSVCPSIGQLVGPSVCLYVGPLVHNFLVSTKFHFDKTISLAGLVLLVRLFICLFARRRRCDGMTFVI